MAHILTPNRQLFSLNKIRDILRSFVISVDKEKEHIG